MGSESVRVLAVGTTAAGGIRIHLTIGVVEVTAEQLAGFGLVNKESLSAVRERRRADVGLLLDTMEQHACGLAAACQHAGLSESAMLTWVHEWADLSARYSKIKAGLN